MTDFDELLGQGRPLLADGGLATSLFTQGLPTGTPPEFWNAAHPERIERLHRAFLDAGADIILTNSFGANRWRLSGHAAERRVGDLNGRAAAIARRAAGALARPVLVAGSVGPTGAAVGELTEADASRIFAEQMQMLAEDGVDAIWIETMSSPAEARAAARAASVIGLPIALTASLHAGSGLDAVSLAALASGLETRPIAIGFNCGTGPGGFAVPLRALRAAMPGAAIVAKPNAGLPVAQGGAWLYPATPHDFAAFAAEAVNHGANIVGGCCGTTPADIRAMHQVMQKL